MSFIKKCLRGLASPREHASNPLDVEIGKGLHHHAVVGLDDYDLRLPVGAELVSSGAGITI